MRRSVPVAALLLGGCYLAHGLEGAPTGRDAGPRFDASAPHDAGPIVMGRDAGLPPHDAGFDAGIVPGLDAGPDAGCVLPVEPFPMRDVCRPETGACISSCGDSQICIVGCLQRDEVCRICAVRNALSCFNEETRCARFYPEVSCCIVESCAATVIDDVLNVCTAIACEEPFTRYADCAIGRRADPCREAIAECGLPPTLLGLD